MAPVHAEQVPTVMSVGRVCSNGLSRTPENTPQSTSAAANKINQLLSESHHWKAQHIKSAQIPLFKIKWGKDGEGGGGEKMRVEGEAHLDCRDVPCMWLL